MTLQTTELPFITRVIVPQRRGYKVSRRRLIDVLKARTNKKAQVITAPAGYGTTFVVGEFEINLTDAAVTTGEEALKTVFVGDSPERAVRAQLLYNGTVFPLQNPVVTLGKAPTADVRLGGLWMRPIQATVVREGDGYRLIGADRGRKVTLNGRRVDSRGANLQHGAAITIGGHQVVFVVEGQ